MKLKPFKEIIKLSKEKFDEAMAPIRAKQVRSKAELEMAKLDEKILSLEVKTQELCAEKEINFETLIKNLDEHALLERRKKQYTQVLDQLFPK